ncbi:MAG TPA: hypothetical protein VNO51_17060 [Ilumatobacteraceae bacterium]|nr:hypothetical protein [Ilumatobacteraceae bacterium]
MTNLVSVWMIGWPGSSWGRQLGDSAVAPSVGLAPILSAMVTLGLVQIWRALSGTRDE